jgi:AcrR family transcriptional regulator
MARRIDIASIRREQIIEAALAVLAEQGLPKMSLSAIEKKAGMSRGQLTYYFRTREDILLAVFDRVLLMMYQRVGGPAPGCTPGGRAMALHLVERMLTTGSISPAFSGLQYTFLAEMNHRPDFRARLARLYGEWRGGMARGLEQDHDQNGAALPASARTVASFVQALLHGLAMQCAVDPDAFDRPEMLALCDRVLGALLDPAPARPRRPARPRTSKARRKS